MSYSLISVREAKANGGGTPTIYAEGVLTPPDVDGDFTLLDAMLYELTTFILGGDLGFLATVW